VAIRDGAGQLLVNVFDDHGNLENPSTAKGAKKNAK